MNKKILYLYTRLSPLKNFNQHLIGGGAQKNLIEISQHMVNRGSQVFIASDEPEQASITDFLKRKNITHFQLPFNKKNILKILYSIYFLHRAVKKKQIDIIHSHHRRTSVLAFIVSKFTRTKLVHTEHNTFSDKKFIRLFKIKNIISVSNGVKKNLVNNYGVDPEKITVIYNGVKMDLPGPEEIGRCYEQNNLKKTDRIFSYIGRISRIKGLDYLIEALVDVKRLFPDIKLLIVGDESHSDRGYKDELILKIEKLGLQNQCFFIGYQKDIRPFICCSEFTVLPSFFEGLPIVVIEALMLNRAVIATNVGGTSEIIQDGFSGKLISPMNAKELSNGIIQFLKHPETTKKMGFAGKAYAAKLFGQTKMLETYDAYYKNLLAHSNR